MKTKNEKEIKIANYLVCLNKKCKNKDGCLRHLALQYNDKKHHFLKVINPLCYPHTNEVCPFFRSATKVHIAWGMKQLYDDMQNFQFEFPIPHTTDIVIRSYQLILIYKNLSAKPVYPVVGMVK